MRTKNIAMILTLALTAGLCQTAAPSQAATPKLSAKKLTMKVGKTAALKVKKTSKKAKWSIVSGKKNIRLTAKKKTSVKVKAVKVGKAKISCKIGKKKLVCKVSVKSDIKENDVKIITDLMMGGAGEVDDSEPLSELHLSAIGEAMNQMMGSAATSMSSMFNRKIDISPPIANMVETYSDSTDDLPLFLKGQFVMVAFKMQIGDLIDSEIMQLYPIEFAKELLNLFTPELNGSSSANVESQPAQPEPVPQPTPASQPTPAPQPAPAPAAPQPDMSAQAPQGMPYGYPQMGMPYGYPPMQGQPMAYGYPPMQGQSAVPQQDVNVAPAAFQPFAGDVNALSQKENIDLIMDVPLDVTVELGRTKKSIKDILEFAPGTIVELNKIAGEAIDVLVNGKYVAKGEVVVIEESFGVRITEIIK